MKPSVLLLYKEKENKEFEKKLIELFWKEFGLEVDQDGRMDGKKIWYVGFRKKKEE